jgi:hypothetical protein
MFICCTEWSSVINSIYSVQLRFSYSVLLRYPFSNWLKLYFHTWFNVFWMYVQNWKQCPLSYVTQIAKNSYNSSKRLVGAMTLAITTFSITIFSIMTLSIKTLSINGLFGTLCIMTRSITTLWHYAECC